MQPDHELKAKLDRIPDLEASYKVELKKYTSFKIGGPADIFLIPESINALKQALSVIDEYSLPLFILGKGSNILVGDRGFRGIIVYTARLNQIEIKGNLITAGSGITLSALANQAMEAALTGLEFASGIPGTLGGALYMNAGAYGGEMKDVVKQALLLDRQGNEMELEKVQLKLAYRSSLLQKKPLITARVTLELRPGCRETISSYMKEINQKRKQKQPLEWPSAGSAFKRPEGYYTGPLIDAAGMKGARVGDAQVSRKHAGFIINLGKATASDVLELMKRIQKKVYANSGVRLEPEPQFIGEF